MTDREVIASISYRTGYAEAQVKKVFEVFEQLAIEQVAVYEPISIPRVGKLAPRRNRDGAVKVKLSLRRSIVQNLGRDFISLVKSKKP